MVGVWKHQQPPSPLRKRRRQDQTSILRPSRLVFLLLACCWTVLYTTYNAYNYNEVVLPQMQSLREFGEDSDMQYTQRTQKQQHFFTFPPQPPLPSPLLSNTTTLKVNSDLELTELYDPLLRAKFNFSERMRYQNRRYRHTPMAGLIENKLLLHDVLQAMHIPTVPVYYGALKSNAMGKWPTYNRTDFLDTMQQQQQRRKKSHSFVVKPTTGMMSECVIAVNDRKWTKENWSMADVADFMDDCVIHEKYSKANMEYEHVGVMVQQNLLGNKRYLQIDSEHGGFEESFLNNDTQSLFELKIHVVFGQLCGARINPMPMKHKAFVDLNLCHNTPQFHFAIGVYGATKQNVYDKVEPVILQHLSTIQDMAQRIYDKFAIDLYRLDLFMDTAGTILMVNEVTYPSFSIFEFDCTVARLQAAYGTRDNSSNSTNRLEIIPSAPLLRSLLDEIHVDLNAFLNKTDFESLKLQYTESEEDSAFFGRWTGDEENDEERNADYDEHDFSPKWLEYTLKQE